MGERTVDCSIKHVDITNNSRQIVHRCGMQLHATDRDRHTANSVRRDKDESSVMGDNASAYMRALQRHEVSSTWVMHGDELQA